MGTWGNGIFENDDALDWVAAFCDEPNILMVRNTLAAVTDLDDAEYLEAPECSKAIVAAEALATLHGKGMGKAPEKFQEAMASLPPQHDPDLVRTAMSALNRIKTDSELKELWQEATDPGQYHGVVEDLERRLKESIA